MTFKVDGDLFFVYAKPSDAQQQMLWDCNLPFTLKINGDATLSSPVKVRAKSGIASFILRLGKTKQEMLITLVTNDLKSKPFVLKIN